MVTGEGSRRCFWSVGLDGPLGDDVSAEETLTGRANLWGLGEEHYRKGGYQILSLYGVSKSEPFLME